MWFIDNSYEIIWDYSDWINLHVQVAPARLNGKIWFVNKAGEIVFDFIYDSYSNWMDTGLPWISTAYVEKNWKCWLISTLGDTIIEPIYNSQFLVNKALSEKYGNN
jgi:hypothetical protein